MPKVRHSVNLSPNIHTSAMGFKGSEVAQREPEGAKPILKNDIGYETGNGPDNKHSLEALLQEIESLTTLPDTYHIDVAQSAPSNGSDEPILSEPRVKVYGRDLCAWGQRSFKGAAQALHRNGYSLQTRENVLLSDSQPSASESRKLKLIRALCVQVQDNLKNIIILFHNGVDADGNLIEKGHSERGLRAGLKAPLDWFRQKLKEILGLLTRNHSKENEPSPTGKLSSRVEKNAACRHFAAVLKETGTSLPPGQQIAFAQWMIEILKSDQGSAEISGVSDALLQRHRQVSDRLILSGHRDEDTTQLGTGAGSDAQHKVREGHAGYSVSEYKVYGLGCDGNDDTTDSSSIASSAGTSTGSDFGATSEDFEVEAEEHLTESDRCSESQEMAGKPIKTICLSNTYLGGGAIEDLTRDVKFSDSSKDDTISSPSSDIILQGPWRSATMADALAGLSDFLTEGKAPKRPNKVPSTHTGCANNTNNIHDQSTKGMNISSEGPPDAIPLDTEPQGPTRSPSMVNAVQGLSQSIGEGEAMQSDGKSYFHTIFPNHNRFEADILNTDDTHSADIMAATTSVPAVQDPKSTE